MILLDENGAALHRRPGARTVAVRSDVGVVRAGSRTHIPEAIDSHQGLVFGAKTVAFSVSQNGLKCDAAGAIMCYLTVRCGSDFAEPIIQPLIGDVPDNALHTIGTKMT